MTETSPSGSAKVPPPLTPHRGHEPSWQHFRSISALVLREMVSKYGRNPGGYIWAVLEPIGMIAALSFGFALVLRSPPLGTSFILFYATGYLPFMVFQKNSRFVMNSLKFSSALLKYPTVTWFDAVSARFLLNTLTELLVSYIIIFSIIVWIDHSAVLRFGPILLAYLYAAGIGLGIGMINCVLAGFVPVWQTIWNILTRPLLLASGVILLYRDLPGLAQSILWWNPLSHVTALARMTFYPTFEPQFISHLYVGTFALVLIAMGLLLLRRFHLEVLERL